MSICIKLQGTFLHLRSILYRFKECPLGTITRLILDNVNKRQ